MTKEELDKFIDEVRKRPYIEYEERSTEDLMSSLSEKEIREIKGIGPINKIKKFFRDLYQAIKYK